MPVRLVISICHLLLLVSCNDRRGVDYATTLTQALLQVLASYSRPMQRFFHLPRLNSHFHALNSHSHSIPIPWLILLPFPWDPNLPHSHAHLYFAPTNPPVLNWRCRPKQVDMQAYRMAVKRLLLLLLVPCGKLSKLSSAIESVHVNYLSYGAQSQLFPAS